MTVPRRLSICYVAPGQDLMSSIGPSRNVVNLAQALSQWADVSVAFRRIADERVPDGLKVLQIQPGGPGTKIDDAAMRGIGYGAFLGYLRALHRFVDRELRTFDVILEKNWLLSGYISALCRRRGQLGVPIENIVPNPVHHANAQLLKQLRLRVGRWIAGRSLRGAPLIIAETEFLKCEIVQYWGVAQQQVEVVDLGVDRTLFKPADQNNARRQLGLPMEPLALLYVGALDLTHDLAPLIRALVANPVPSVVLHVAGDGPRRQEYEAMAAGAGPSIVFHGRVPHHEVPLYIAAADICVAPYDAKAFASGELGYSTMKIPEYLSVGRAVVSVPSGRTRTLIEDQQTGFLFTNDVDNWRRFLAELPDRERLRDMGAAAACLPRRSWDDTARSYLDLCMRQLQSSRPG